MEDNQAGQKIHHPIHYKIMRKINATIVNNSKHYETPVNILSRQDAIRIL